MVCVCVWWGGRKGRRDNINVHVVRNYWMYNYFNVITVILYTNTTYIYATIQFLKGLIRRIGLYSIYMVYYIKLVVSSY